MYVVVIILPVAIDRRLVHDQNAPRRKKDPIEHRIVEGALMRRGILRRPGPENPRGDIPAEKPARSMQMGNGRLRFALPIQHPMPHENPLSIAGKNVVQIAIHPFVIERFVIFSRMAPQGSFHQDPARAGVEPVEADAAVQVG